MIRDSGEPDAIAPQAEQHALEDLPVNVLIYLLGSRYCETDRLSNKAWSLFGQVPKGWPLVQAICDYVHDRIKFGYEHASPTKTAWERPSRAARRLPRLRPPRDHAVPLHEYSGALLHRLSRRYRRAARPRADGFFRLVRSLSRRPLVHIRCAPQHAAHRPHPDGARPRRHRRRHRHLVRAMHHGELQGRHRGSAGARGRRRPERLRSPAAPRATDRETARRRGGRSARRARHRGVRRYSVRPLRNRCPSRFWESASPRSRS